MKFTIDNISAFVSLATMGSFQRAAFALKITQPALTRRIQRLEDSIGVHLIDRSSKDFRLTTFGRDYFPIAQRTINDFRRSNDQLADLMAIRAGSVKVSMNMTVTTNILPKILKIFAIEYPGIIVHIMEDSGPAVARKVISGEVEFGVAPLTEHHSALLFEECYKDKFVMIAHSSHSLLNRDQLTWQSIARENFIKMHPDSGTRKLIENALMGRQIYLHGTYEVTHLPALLGLVANNLGISAVPHLSSSNVADPPIATREISGPIISRSIGIITNRNTNLSPAAEKLKTIVKNVFENQIF